MASQPPTTGTAETTAGAGSADVPTEHRYRSLSIIATLLTVFGWLVVVLGGLGVIGGTIYTIGVQGLPQAIGVLVLGAIYVALFALYAFAGAAVLRLFMAVEENTRVTAAALTSGRR